MSNKNRNQANQNQAAPKPTTQPDPAVVEGQQAQPLSTDGVVTGEPSQENQAATGDQAASQDAGQPAAESQVAPQGEAATESESNGPQETPPALEEKPAAPVAPVAPAAPVTSQDKAAQDLSDASTPGPDAPDVAALAGITQRGNFVLIELDEYEKRMNPKAPMDSATGARLQASLYRALLKTINELDTDFAVVFTEILRRFRVNTNNIYKTENVFRFMEDVALGEKDRKAFQRILNLLMITAPVNGRATVLRQVSLVKSFEFSVNEAGRQRVAAYFGL